MNYAHSTDNAFRSLSIHCFSSFVFVSVHSMVTWNVIFARNHSNPMEILSVIYFCCIPRLKRDSHVRIVMPNVCPIQYCRLTWNRTKRENHFHASVVAKISPANIIWIDTHSTRIAISRDQKKKFHVMFVEKCSREQTICVNIYAFILASRHENVTISVRTVKSVSMGHRCWSENRFWNSIELHFIDLIEFIFVIRRSFS